MNVIEKSTGTHVAYEVGTKSITFGDDDLTINLKNREKDNEVIIYICLDSEGELTMGTAAGKKFAAEIRIPARTYTESTGTDDEGNETVVQTANDFDIDNCTLYLFAID